MPNSSGNSKQKQRVASISLDLDNLWSYMKTHGDEGWESYPSYLDMVVPRILRFLANRQLKITFFIVGQDAAIESNRHALQQIADAGHEIANHSFHHEPWLHLYSPEKLRNEFQRSEEAIFQATGHRTRAFRGPGFSFSGEVLKTLIERGYRYDGSTFPTFLGPVARAYYFFTSKLDKGQKEDRKQLFGKFSDGFQSVKPYRWQIDEGEILEMPVTTMPIFKVPIHASYISFLAGYSKSVARLYYWMALKLCWMTRTQPSFLLHPLDFMDKSDCPELAFFPGMKLDSDVKLDLLDSCFSMMEKHWRLVSMGEHAEELEKKRLKTARYKVDQLQQAELETNSDGPGELSEASGRQEEWGSDWVTPELSEEEISERAPLI